MRQEAVEFPMSQDFEAMVKDSYALVVITAHRMYEEFDLSQLNVLLKDFPILIEERTTFDPETVEEQGYVYRGLERGRYR